MAMGLTVSVLAYMIAVAIADDHTSNQISKDIKHDCNTTLNVGGPVVNSGVLTIDEQAFGDEFDCILPAVVEHGYFKRRGAKIRPGMTVQPGAQVRLICDEGYGLDDRKNNGFGYCTEDGTWQPALTKCSPGIETAESPLWPDFIFSLTRDPRKTTKGFSLSPTGSRGNEIPDIGNRAKETTIWPEFIYRLTKDPRKTTKVFSLSPTGSRNPTSK